MELLRFSRSQRLLTSRDFKATFNQAKIRFSTPVLLILVAEQVSNSPESDQISATAEHLETTPARLGLVVAKKHLKRAVDRNRFKRLVRESFRSHQEQLAGLDVVVLARNGAIRSIRSQEQNVENTESVEKLLTKAWRYIQRKRN